MSTILDALRKSEQERKLNKLPTLVDMTAPHEPSRWPVYIGAALVVLASALVLLAYIIWSAEPEAVKIPNNVKDVSVSEGRQLRADVSLRVNVVSYSDDAKLRFAMVNGKLMREGEFVAPGLKVESIQLKSVVFNSRGQKITLSPE